MNKKISAWAMVAAALIKTGMAVAAEPGSEATSPDPELSRLVATNEPAEMRNTAVTTAPNIVERLGAIIGDHPRLRQSRQEICETNYAIIQERTAYYPTLDASLSTGDRLIDKTTRGDQFGGSNAPEYDGKGTNVSLNLRQKIYDWGETRAAINRASLTREAAGLEGRQLLENQLAQFYQTAFDYLRTEKILAELEKTSAAISTDMVSVKKRFEAGAGRIAEVRAGQIIELDIQTKVTSIQNQRAIAEEALKTNFEASGDFAEKVIEIYLARRPEFPDVIPSEETLEWRVLDARARAEGHEIRRLKASRLPEFTGVISGQAWDVTDRNRCGDVLPTTHPDASFLNGEYRRYRNCYTYEVSGRVEMSLPLYDGGLSAAQRNRAAARRSALQAEMAALDRSYRAQSQRLNDTLADLTLRIDRQNQKLVELRAQLDSEERVQVQTRRDPLALARLRSELAVAVEEQVGLEVEAEITRLRMLAITHSLADMMDIAWETGGC